MEYDQIFKDIVGENLSQPTDIANTALDEIDTILDKSLFHLNRE